MTTALRPPMTVRATEPLVLQLSDALDETLVGGKALNLGRAIASGVRVPEGVVLTTHALELQLSTDDLRNRLTAAVERVASAPPTARVGVAQEAATQCAAMFTATALLAETRGALREATRALLTLGPVAVRSSAVGEDSERESFAGQLDSFLDLRTPEDVEGALLRCWASCWSSRALAYRAARGGNERGMGVIVQRQVDAKAAGVMFTRSADGGILVEYAAGLAVALVAGEINPARFTLQRDGTRPLLLQSLEPADASVDALVLSRSLLAALAKVATTLERAFGEPQDVEWAIDQTGMLHVVQSRPVTVPIGAASLRDDGRRVAWSNANINENFPTPVSPFLYSLASAGYAHYFRGLARAFGMPKRRIAAMDDALRHIIGVFGARMYYNLSSIHTVLRAAPFGGALVAAFNRFTGAGGSEGVAVDDSSGPLRRIAELAWMVAKSSWTYIGIGRRVASFEALVNDFAARTRPAALARASTRDLRLLLAELMDIRCNRWTNAALADAAAMVSYAALHRVVRAAGGTAGASRDDGAAHNTLLQAIPGLVSSEPVHRLWDLSRLVRQDAALAAFFAGAPAEALAAIARDSRFAGFRHEFERYLDDWGFRCSSELLLTEPSFQEDPTSVIETIQAYARVDSGSPAEALARQLNARNAALARLIASARGRRLSSWLPFVGFGTAIRVTLRCAQASIAYRERARLKQALLYNRCRLLVLALGDRLFAGGYLGQSDDAFWLTVGELDELASGCAMFPRYVRDLVALRHRAHEEVSAQAPPDRFTLPEGVYPRAGSVPLADGGASPDAGGLRGTSACGGRASGRAVVLLDVREAGRLERGDILVTRQTDPGWAPAFFLIGGLVIERGGMLSHGAIVAREFGIPCVVSVAAATERIVDGQRIEVDGDAGVVHVLD